MSFVSYAQNFEDVILWRALKHVDKGFYIDVGAHDPDTFSVTKAFYEHGWHGINIEPVDQWYEKLEAARPRDINLTVAAGAERGRITLYEIPDTGLSTVDSKTATRHREETGYEIIERKIEVHTLTEICSDYHAAPIHLLKIDVEGAEKSVLEGLDLEQIRPWIIVVEAILPGSQTEDFDQWEPSVVHAGYDFVYFDGLNRFYVAAERDELRAAFSAPPNVFDDFIRADERDAMTRAEEAQSRSNQLETELGQMKGELATARAQIEQLEQHLMAVYVSKSWRMTHPLRVAMNGLRRAKAKIALSPLGMRHAVKAIIKALFAPMIRFALSRPALKSRALTLVHKYPVLEFRLRRLAAARGLTEVDMQISKRQQQLLSVELSHLTPTARRIYADLKAAIAERQEDLS